MEEVSVERLDVERIARSGESLVTDEKELLSRVNVDVSIVLGSAEITMDRLLNLSGGDVVELRQQVGDPIALVYDGQTIARGVLVANEGKLGLKIIK
jgi:flagellar motor switch protein FliN/FliY